jgi:hypothetical protein
VVEHRYVYKFCHVFITFCKGIEIFTTKQENDGFLQKVTVLRTLLTKVTGQKKTVIDINQWHG